MKYNDLLSLTISSNLDLKNKISKRIYIASFLNILLGRIEDEYNKNKSVSYKKHINHIKTLLKDLENNTGGLTIAEIGNISKFEYEITSISKEDINNYSSQNSTKLEKYGEKSILNQLTVSSDQKTVIKKQLQ